MYTPGFQDNRQCYNQVWFNKPHGTTPYNSSQTGVTDGTSLTFNLRACNINKGNIGAQARTEGLTP